MIDLNDILANLTQGDLPLSIATSLAIESACGIKKDLDANGEPIPTAPKRPPLNDVSELWINIRTLFRNVYYGIDGDMRPTLLPHPLLEVVIQEMNLIPGIIKQFMGDKVKVHFYICSYKGLNKIFPNAMLKEVNTQKQKEYWQLEQYTVQHFFSKELPVEKFDVKITGRHPNSFILTHLAVDLLWRYSFDKLLLLESHTGKIKPFTEWNTKLTNGKEYPQLPFNRLTLQVLGDSNNYFSAIGLKLKREIIELSIKRKWTPVTGKEKIQYDISTIRDHPVRQYFLDLLKE